MFKEPKIIKCFLIVHMTSKQKCLLCLRIIQNHCHLLTWCTRFSFLLKIVTNIHMRSTTVQKGFTTQVYGEVHWTDSPLSLNNVSKHLPKENHWYIVTVEFPWCNFLPFFTFYVRNKHKHTAAGMRRMELTVKGSNWGKASFSVKHLSKSLSSTYQASDENHDTCKDSVS